MKRNLLYFVSCFVCVLCLSLFLHIDKQGVSLEMDSVNAALPTYSITPTTKPLDNYGVGTANYTSKTKHTYLLNSYMKKFETTKGGTLVLTKGVYNLSNVVYIPSNVTVILNDGVTIKKIYATDVKGLNPAAYMLAFAPFSKRSAGASDRSKGIKEYAGTQNSHIIGKGNATINANGAASGNFKFNGIVFGHNKNCSVKNINFIGKDGVSGHYMEVDATLDCVISGNNFSGGNTAGKEAINLDTPDDLTKGFTAKWSSLDCTRNYRLNITNNKFSNMTVAIGTHAYSYGKPHKFTSITNNTFTNVNEKVIQPMNWKNTTITGNTFNGSVSKAVIHVRGINDLVIHDNTFNLTNNALVYHFRAGYHSSTTNVTLNKVHPVVNRIAEVAENTERNKNYIINQNTYTGSYNKKITLYENCAWSDTLNRYEDTSPVYWQLP